VLLAEQMAALALKVSAQGYVLRQGRVVREGRSQELVDSGLVAALSSAYL
jgi:branched-chain amino acid transport system ATP-binding protein